MDFEYLDHKRLLGGVMPDNTVTKVITHDKFSLSGEERSHRCWGKEKFVLFWFWDGKPVVSSGKFGSSENQPIQTDCLWNLWVNIEAENSKILVASFGFYFSDFLFLSFKTHMHLENNWKWVIKLVSFNNKTKGLLPCFARLYLYLTGWCTDLNGWVFCDQPFKMLT